MNQTLLVGLFIPLFIMAVLWLPMVGYLLHSIAKRHPTKYQAMGRPSLFNPNPMHLARLFRFLFTSECHSLGDSRVSALSNVMRAWFVVYLIGGVALVGLVVRSAGP
ncbi:hypothetical protein [Lysobacter sp. P5_B9]